MSSAPPGKVTSFDIAYLAGVSQPTVSRALRGDRAVSPATREKIQRIARELNYTVDKNASSLRTQRSNTLALLFFEEPAPDDSRINPFFLTMLGSITRAASARGFDLLVSFQRLEDDWHTRYEDSHRADGLILLGYGDNTLYERRLEQLTQQGSHYVRWGPVEEPGSGAVIGSDNRAAGHAVGEHLLAVGCSRIVFLGQADASYPEFRARYAGLVSAVAEQTANVQVWQQDALNSEEEGFAAMAAVLRSGRMVDAVFAGSDTIAIGAMRAVSQAGLRVPQDIAVVGFDNIPVSALLSPALTTVTQDTSRAAEELVEALVRQIGGGAGETLVLPTRLVARASTARLRA